MEQLQAEVAAAATQHAGLHEELAAAQQAASGAARGAQDAQQQLAEAQAVLRAAELESQALRQELGAAQGAQARAAEQVGSSSCFLLPANSCNHGTFGVGQADVVNSSDWAVAAA